MKGEVSKRLGFSPTRCINADWTACRSPRYWVSMPMSAKESLSAADIPHRYHQTRAQGCRLPTTDCQRFGVPDRETCQLDERGFADVGSAGWQPPVPSDVPSHAQTAALARVFSPTVPRFTSETDPLAEREGFEHSVPRKGTTFFRQESFSAVVGGCEIPGDCADMNKKRQSRPCTSLRIAA